MKNLSGIIIFFLSTVSRWWKIPHFLFFTKFYFVWETLCHVILLVKFPSSFYRPVVFLCHDDVSLIVMAHVNVLVGCNVLLLRQIDLSSLDVPVQCRSTGFLSEGLQTSLLLHCQQLSLNMASQLINERSCIRHCWVFYEQNSIMNCVRVDDWTAERVIIVSNGSNGTEEFMFFSRFTLKIGNFWSYILSDCF